MLRTDRFQILLPTLCCVCLLAGSSFGKGKPGGGGGGGGDTEPAYVVVDLGPDGNRAEALNNLGGVIKGKNGLDELWEFADDGTILDIRGLPGLVGEPVWTSTNDINDQFRIAGSAEYFLENEFPPRAVAWDVGGELPNGIEATDVNSNGIVVGRQSIAGGAASVWVLQFDENGDLVGSSDPVALPGLGGPPIDIFEITDTGLIAGDSWTANLEWHAALWMVDATGQFLGIEDLGLPGNNDKAGAAATNMLGDTIVNARAENTKGKNYTITWTPYIADVNGNLTPLNSLNMDLGNLRELEIGLDINDLGWISGRATTRTDTRAFVAIPVP